VVIATVTDVVNGNSAPDDRPMSPSSILARLRHETRDAHKDLERVLDFTSATLTRDLYRRRLAQYYGFYAPLEAALRRRCGEPDATVGDAPSLGATLDARLCKTPLLRQDLEHLQVGVDTLPLCHDLPSLRTHADMLGCLYVLEGATLGGRMIIRHLETALGITPTTGGRFFDGYADDTGRMWNAMREMLTTHAVDVDTENDIVANAIVTFTCLRQWCEPGAVVTTDVGRGEPRAVPDA